MKSHNFFFLLIVAIFMTGCASPIGTTMPIFTPTAPVKPTNTPSPTLTKTPIPLPPTLTPTSTPIPDIATCLLKQDQVSGYFTIADLTEQRSSNGIYVSSAAFLIPSLEDINYYLLNYIYVSSNSADLQWPSPPNQANILPPPNVGDSAVAYQSIDKDGRVSEIAVDFKRGNALSTIKMYKRVVADEDPIDVINLDNILKFAKIVDSCLQSTSPYPQLIFIPPQHLDPATFNHNFDFIDIGQKRNNQFEATTTVMRNQTVCVQYAVISPILLTSSVHWYILDDMTQTIIYHSTQPADNPYGRSVYQRCFIKLESPGNYQLMVFINQTLTKSIPFTVP